MSERRKEQLRTYVAGPLMILLILLVGVLNWKSGDWADPWEALLLCISEILVLYICYAVLHNMREGLRILAKLRPLASRSQGVS